MKDPSLLSCIFFKCYSYVVAISSDRVSRSYVKLYMVICQILKKFWHVLVIVCIYL